jgi:hypothetical protein
MRASRRHPLDRLHRHILRHLGRELAAATAAPTRELSALAARYRQAVEDQWQTGTVERACTAVSRQSLLYQATRSDVILVGDHHVLPRVQLEAARVVRAWARASAR